MLFRAERTLEDLPESYRCDLEERFSGEPEELEEAAERILTDIEFGSPVPVRHLEMDTLCFINGKVAHAIYFHSVHQTEDAYYGQWANVFEDNRIRAEDNELTEKWNWCVENLKGHWSVSSENQHQSSYVYTVAIADDDDAARFMLKWGNN